MRKVTIKFPKRDWNKFSAQNIEGEIIQQNNQFKARVEIPQLPGDFIDFDIVCPVNISDDLVETTVVGDISQDEFHVRMMCFLKPLSID